MGCENAIARPHPPLEREGRERSERGGVNGGDASE